MSDSNRSRPGVEVLLLGLVVAGAIFAWMSRGSTPKSAHPAESTSSARSAADSDSSGWAARASRPRRRIPYDAAVIARAESQCMVMAQTRVSDALHEGVSAEITDKYAVGDPETGAGDSTIIEGIARGSSGKSSDFRCSAANMATYPAVNYLTYHERQ